MNNANASFNNAGNRVLTSSFDDQLSYLYDLNGKQLAQFEGVLPSFNNAGDRVLAFSDNDDQLSYLYDLNGKQLAQFEGVLPSFNNAGDRVLTSSYIDDRSYLYDLSGKQLAQVQGRDAKFNKSGQRIIVVSQDEDISRIYDISGNLLAEFSGSAYADDYISDKNKNFFLGFTADETQFITLSKDNILHIWKVDRGLDDLLSQGCRLLKDYLTSDDSKVTNADRALCNLPPQPTEAQSANP